MRERGILSRFLYVIALNRALRNIKENPLRRVFSCIDFPLSTVHNVSVSLNN